MAALPPTTNTLTAEQRNILLRKSRKIEQLLGSAPLLVELQDGIGATDQENATSKVFGGYRRRRTASAPSDPTSSFSSQLSHDSRRSCHLRRKRHQSPPVLSNTSNQYLLQKDFPLLRIGLDRLQLEPITAPSPSSARFKTFDMARQSQETESPNSSADQEEQKQTCGASGFPQSQLVGHDETQRGDADSPKTDLGTGIVPLDEEILSQPRTRGSHAHSRSTTSSMIRRPSFTIPSSVNVRKAKMDRLRKKLGAHVPYELVFPDDYSLPNRRNILSPSEISPAHSRNPSSSSTPSPTPRIEKHRHSPPKSAGHLGLGQEWEAPDVFIPMTSSLPPPPRPSPLKKNHRRPSSTKRGHPHRTPRRRLADPPPPLPTLPTEISNPKPLREKLSLILESPDELAFDFEGDKVTTLPRITESPASSRPSSAESLTSSGCGWAVSTAPTTPTTSMTSCSSPSTPSITSATATKKRSSSYRKKPPPITEELIAALTQNVLPTYHP